MTEDHPVGLALMAQLEESGAITSTSLTLKSEISFSQYEALFVMFGQLQDTSSWVIGDLLNYGERVYGETYAQAASLTGLNPQTLMNYASVCSRIPRSRRKSTLKFGTHALVAYMDPQDQIRWLDLAESQGMTRSQLRQAIEDEKALKNPQPAPTAVPDLPLEIDGGVVPRDGAGNAVEILPPAVDYEICQCPACGRYHRTDIDVSR